MSLPKPIVFIDPSMQSIVSIHKSLTVAATDVCIAKTTLHSKLDKFFCDSIYIASQTDSDKIHHYNLLDKCKLAIKSLGNDDSKIFDNESFDEIKESIKVLNLNIIPKPEDGLKSQNNVKVIHSIAKVKKSRRQPVMSLKTMLENKQNYLDKIASIDAEIDKQKSAWAEIGKSAGWL